MAKEGVKEVKERFVKKAETEERIEGEIRFPEGYAAEVKELVARGGSRGELTQVMCQIPLGFHHELLIL